MDIQGKSGTHDSREDSIATMEVYLRVMALQNSVVGGRPKNKKCHSKNSKNVMTYSSKVGIAEKGLEDFLGLEMTVEDLEKTSSMTE